MPNILRLIRLLAVIVISVVTTVSFCNINLFSDNDPTGIPASSNFSDFYKIDDYNYRLAVLTLVLDAGTTANNARECNQHELNIVPHLTLAPPRYVITQCISLPPNYVAIGYRPYKVVALISSVDKERKPITKEERSETIYYDIQLFQKIQDKQDEKYKLILSGSVNRVG